MLGLLNIFFPAKDQSFEHFPKYIPPKSTPYYIIDQSIVLQKILSIKNSFNKNSLPFLIAFSFKTNYDFAKSKFLTKNHILAETVSEYEYKIALKLGFNSSNIILNGPNKTNILSVLKTKSIIHLDNFNEIDQLPSSGITAQIGIRLNFNSTNSRFGFKVDNGDALKAINILKDKNIKLDSLHIHLGSDIYDPELYKQAAIKTTNFIIRHKLTPKTIDFGGGYSAHGAIPYGLKHANTPDISEYINVIINPLKQLSYKPTIIVEPGRYLIDDATVFVTKIINKTIKNNTQIITVDSTINMLPSLWYRPATIRLFDYNLCPTNTPKIKTIVYGSSCQEHDIMYQGINNNSNIGDLIIFYAVGAYNQSMCPDFIYQKPNSYFV